MPEDFIARIAKWASAHLAGAARTGTCAEVALLTNRFPSALRIEPAQRGLNEQPDRGFTIILCAFSRRSADWNA